MTAIEVEAADRSLLARLREAEPGRMLVYFLDGQDRPPHGLAGLIDFDSGGRLSRLLRDPAVFSGRPGEGVLLRLDAPGLRDPTLLAGLGPWGEPGEASRLARAWVERIVALGGGSVLLGLPAGPRHASDRLAFAEALARAIRAAEAGDERPRTWTFVVEPTEVVRLSSRLQGPLRAAGAPPATPS